MINVIRFGVLLEPTKHYFESVGVLNPAVIKVGSEIFMFYRAVAKGNFSTIGYCKFSSPTQLSFRSEQPLIVSEFPYESHGLEDPRIVKIENVYYITYTAYDGINALGALATSIDLMHWEKQGIIVPKISRDELNSKLSSENQFVDEDGRSTSSFIWDKNLVLFPRKINSKFYFLHRIKPNIQIVVGISSFTELTTAFWNLYFDKYADCVVLAPKYDHESDYIGSGCPPLETQFGWLLIYHGVQSLSGRNVYAVCAALLDLEKPQIELSRLPYPLFVPEELWEMQGEVDNVCFPTGLLLEKEFLFIYYGAADTRIAVAAVEYDTLLSELMKFKN